MIVLVTMIIVTISIKLAKKKSHEIIDNHRATGAVRKNQAAYNGDLAESIVLVIICAFSILLAIMFSLPSLHINASDDNIALKTAATLFNTNFFVIFSMTILPGISIISNPKSRKFVVDEIKDLMK